MRMEYYLLAIIAAAAVASAVVPRRLPAKASPAEDDNTAKAAGESAEREFAAFKHLTSHFCKRIEEIRDLIAKSMNDAAGQLHMTDFKRGLLEDCICGAEVALRDQDKALLLTGHITSGLEMDYLKRIEGIDMLESSWIFSQQKALANVQKISDHVFALQELAQELTAWKVNKSQQIQEEASQLYRSIVTEAETVYQVVSRMRAEASVDPVGIDIKDASALVTNFRAERAAARTQIRLRLAEKAREKRSQ